MKFDLVLFERVLDEAHYAHETRCTFEYGVEILKNTDTKDMTHKQEQQFYAIAIGTIILGLSINKTKYYDDKDRGKCNYLTYISPDPNDEYYQVPLYPLSYNEIKDKITDEISVETVGNKVLNDELFFNKEQMIAIFPELELLFNKVEYEIAHKKNYHRLERAFEMASASDTVALNTNKMHFLTTVTELKEEILKQFQVNHTEFTYGKCLALVNSLKKLTVDLMNGRAAQKHIDRFKETYNTFNDALKKHSNVNPSTYSFRVFAYKSSPLDKVVEAASKIVSNSTPQADVK